MELFMKLSNFMDAQYLVKKLMKKKVKKNNSPTDIMA